MGTTPSASREEECSILINLKFQIITNIETHEIYRAPTIILATFLLTSSNVWRDSNEQLTMPIRRYSLFSQRFY